MDKHIIAYQIGIFILFSTHARMIFQDIKHTHAYVSMAGIILVAYYFMHRESYIKF